MRYGLDEEGWIFGAFEAWYFLLQRCGRDESGGIGTGEARG